MSKGIGRAFLKDLLRIEVSGPNRPYLIIIDLPSLINNNRWGTNYRIIGLLASLMYKLSAGLYWFKVATIVS